MHCYRVKGLRWNLSQYLLRLCLVDSAVNACLICLESQEFAGWDALLPCEGNHSVSLTLGYPPQAAQCPVVLQGGPFF